MCWYLKNSGKENTMLINLETCATDLEKWVNIGPTHMILWKSQIIKCFWEVSRRGIQKFRIQTWLETRVIFFFFFIYYIHFLYLFIYLFIYLLNPKIMFWVKMLLQVNKFINYEISYFVNPSWSHFQEKIMINTFFNSFKEKINAIFQRTKLSWWTKSSKTGRSSWISNPWMISTTTHLECTSPSMTTTNFALKSGNITNYPRFFKTLLNIPGNKAYTIISLFWLIFIVFNQKESGVTSPVRGIRLGRDQPRGSVLWLGH